MGDIFIQWGTVLLVCRVADGAANRYSLGGGRPLQWPSRTMRTGPQGLVEHTPVTGPLIGKDLSSLGVLAANNALFFTKVAWVLPGFLQALPQAKLLGKAAAKPFSALYE